MVLKVVSIFGLFYCNFIDQRRSKSFWGLLGFEAAKLQPEITIAFLTAVIKKFFFHNQKNFLEDCLAVSSHMGSHSAVVYLRGNGKAPYRYVWAHPVHAPFGMPTPLSCICGMVGSAIAPPTRKRKRQELRAEKLEVHCEMCTHVRKFRMPDDFEFRVEDGDGIWGRMPLKFLCE